MSVYDTKDWGKGVISKTKRTMTVLFNGLTESDSTTTTSGKDFLISKAADNNKTITVKNWSYATHNIVFADSMTAFDKYIKASSPTSKQLSAART